jgi:hypothetical protein
MSTDRSTGLRAWWAAFLILSTALVLPLWLVTYPPGVDLPQHAAQVAIGQHWSNTALPYREYYELNPLSQSLIAHGLVYAFASVFSIASAIKLTVSLALLAIPVVSIRIIRAVDGDRWWVFAVFPVAYSYGFFWGFLNYIVGIPLGLLLIATVAAHVQAPARRSYLALALLPPLVFLGHVLALFYAGLVSATLVFFALRGRERWISLACLMVVVPIVLAWFIGVQLAAPSSTPTPTIFGYGLGRVLALPNFLVGIPGEMTYTALGILALASPMIAGARPTALGWRWIPALLCLALYLSVPQNVLGTAFIYPRYAVFLVPALFLALRPGPALGPGGRIGRTLVVSIALVSALAMCFRFVSFEHEAKAFHGIAEHVEPGSRVLGLTYGAASTVIPYPVYLHWVCWLQVERNAVADFSFAEFFPNTFRYKPEHDPDLPPHVEWAPSAFRWVQHDGINYDYFLIRNRERVAPHTFAGATTELELVHEQGVWSLVRQHR